MNMNLIYETLWGTGARQGGRGGQETQVDSFDRSNNTDAIDLKMNVSLK